MFPKKSNEKINLEGRAEARDCSFERSLIKTLEIFVFLKQSEFTKKFNVDQIQEVF